VRYPRTSDRPQSVSQRGQEHSLRAVGSSGRGIECERTCVGILFVEISRKFPGEHQPAERIADHRQALNKRHRAANKTQPSKQSKTAIPHATRRPLAPIAAPLITHHNVKPSSPLLLPIAKIEHATSEHALRADKSRATHSGRCSSISRPPGGSTHELFSLYFSLSLSPSFSLFPSVPSASPLTHHLQKVVAVPAVSRSSSWAQISLPGCQLLNNFPIFGQPSNRDK